MSPQPDFPEKSGNNTDQADFCAGDAAEIAAAFLDLWQRNIAAIAADPRSGPNLAMTTGAAEDWLRKSRPSGS